MRDHPWTFWAILTPIGGAWIYFSPYRWELITAIIWGMLLAHLWWGSKVIPDQQEEPTFDPLHPIRSVEAIRLARKSNLL